MDKKEAVKKFREHWKAISESDLYFCGKSETDIFVEYLLNDCFLCEYTTQDSGLKNCDLCPIDWVCDYVYSNNCYSIKSPYRAWHKVWYSYLPEDLIDRHAYPWSNLILPSGAKALAKKISELPER